MTCPSFEPYFDKVALLLHMDGTNGDTTFTDSSNQAYTVTANGNAQLSTAQAKSGTASGYFDGDGDYLSVSGAELAVGSGNFTLECFIYLLSTGGYRGICGLDASSDNNRLYLYNDTLIWYDGGSYCDSGPLPLNQWIHVAAVRKDGMLSLYVDGTRTSTTYSSGANISAGAITIGCGGSVTREFFHGYMDDLRITKGVARYTANFTVLDCPFPDALGGLRITSVTPNFGSVAGGAQLTFSGGGFTVDSTITIDGNLVQNLTFVSESTMTGTAPAGTPGWKDVTVYNP